MFPQNCPEERTDHAHCAAAHGSAPDDWRLIREAFVVMIKEENAYHDYGKQSLRAHWAGHSRGFADEYLQRRYKDFTAGWRAAQNNPSDAPTGRVE